MNRPRSDEDFRDELEAHIRIEADRLAEEGMRPDEAMAAARRAFGNVTARREDFYESKRRLWLDALSRDVSLAVRRIRDSPLVSATIVLSLALGIGFTTAIFSLADQALVRALPVRAPDRLVQLEWNGEFIGSGMGSVGVGSLIPYPLYRELRADNQVFEDLLGQAAAEVHLTVGGESEPAAVELVTGSYFPTLGVRAALGRLLSVDDDLQPDSHPVVVLSHDYWQGRLGGDPAVVGTTVRINDYPMTVVGVAEPGFRGMDWFQSPALWVPMMMKARVTPGWSGLDNRRNRFMHAFGRLAPGVGREQAQAALQPWFKAYLQADTEREGWPQLTEQQLEQYLGSSLDLLPGGQGDTFLQSYVIEKPILILAAASALILLLACLNVANLSLARALTRRRATALRTALGAPRGRIVTEQLVESALLAVVGCIAGALLAPAVIRGLLTFLPRFNASGPALSAALDVRVLLFAAAATAAAALLSGTLPALFAASIRPVVALKEQASAVVGGFGLRKALVVGQFSLALLLLIGAGLFAKTLATLRSAGPGFSTANLLMFRLSPLNDGYVAAESKLLVRRALAELERLPDVEHVGALRMEMLRFGGWNNPLTVEADERVVTKTIGMNAVTPDLFPTLGARILRGRNFDDHDGHDDSRWDLESAIVNEEFVKQYIANADPVGARLGIGDRPETAANIEIVGVVETFHNWSLREPEPQVFFPLWQLNVDGGTFYVRSRSSSEAAAKSIRAALTRIGPNLTVHSMRTIDDQLDRMLTTERMLSTLAAAFAATATFLAMIGLYGVLSFSAARRKREMGVRLALGAPRWSAGGLIVREAAWLAFLGAAIALPAAWVLGRLIESQLFGVRPMDAATLAAAAALLCAVCLAASAGPARRASLVDPFEALRGD